MDYFLQVFASFASLFASLAHAQSVAVIMFCIICIICVTRALCAHAHTYARTRTRTHTCLFYTKMTQMTQTDSQLFEIIKKVFCITFGLVMQMMQKVVVSLEKKGFVMDLNIVECKTCGKAYWAEVKQGCLIASGPCCFGHDVLDIERFPNEHMAKSGYSAMIKKRETAIAARIAHLKGLARGNGRPAAQKAAAV